MCAFAVHQKRETELPDWAVPVAGRLELVERVIESALDSGVEVASEITAHLFSAGGKRIRPALVTLSAAACGGESSDGRVTSIAAAAELVHTASLLHDDVVDAASARRGVSTANATWGNTLSVLGGDFLLSKAFSLLAEVGHGGVLSVLSAAAVSMAESEMLQAVCEGSIELWQANYWRIIRGKTASLMAACCECGAMLAGANPAVRQALREYGADFGLAFQVTDDLLDVTGSPAQTGKDIGADLVNGKFTLPVLLAARDGLVPKPLIETGCPSPEDARRIVAAAIECGAAEETRRMAEDYADRARRCLEGIPESEHKAALEVLACSITTRDL